MKVLNSNSPPSPKPSTTSSARNPSPRAINRFKFQVFKSSRFISPQLLPPPPPPPDPASPTLRSPQSPPPLPSPSSTAHPPQKSSPRRSSHECHKNSPQVGQILRGFWFRCRRRGWSRLFSGRSESSPARRRPFAKRPPGSRRHPPPRCSSAA